MTKKDFILDAAIPIVGHFGIKKTSVDELAKAAGLSKQGLYLHFSSKEELLAAAMRRYFDRGLELVAHALNQPNAPLDRRLVAALDAWFGRHLINFHPSALEVIEPHAAPSRSADNIKRKVMEQLARAIESSPDFQRRDHRCSPEELARVLFQFGLTWKEGHPSRQAFRKTLELCVRACCPLAPSSKTKKRKR